MILLLLSFLAFPIKSVLTIEHIWEYDKSEDIEKEWDEQDFDSVFFDQWPLIVD